MARTRLLRTEKLTIWLTADELGRLAAAAADLAMAPSDWIRHQALRAVPEASRLPARFQPLPAANPSARFTRRLDFCLTEEQFEALDEQARACGLTLSALIRDVLAGRKPVARHPLARSAIVAVNRASDTLSQLLQLASSGALLTPDLSSAVAGLRQEIHALRDALLAADAATSPEPPA
jgi:hypothetical protein